MAGNLTAMIASIFSGGVTADPYYEYTTLLLPGNGTNGAQNNTFLDSSSNNFTITRNGNTTQGMFSPFSQTGWGNFATATSGSVGFSCTTASLVGQTASTFTAECWIYMTEAPVSGDGVPSLIGMDAAYNSSVYLGFGPNASRVLVLRWFDGASKTVTGSTTLALNTWYHVAVVANSNALAMYVNGNLETLSGTTTLTNRNGTTTDFSLLLNSSSSNYQFRGYVSNIRVCTSAVYTTPFTPSTLPLTTTSQGATNCQLLTAQDNRFIDKSSNGYLLVAQGSPSVVAFSPFNPTASWSAATYGGSGYFDGSGDYLSVASNAAFNLGTVFSVETFFYTTSTAKQVFFQLSGYVFYVDSNKLTIWAPGSIGGTGTDVPINSWAHIVFTRDSSNQARAFVNGVLAWSASMTAASSQTIAYIGAENGSISLVNGYMSNIRFVKGDIPTAYQTTSNTAGTTIFTPPTAPLTAITNTSLLLNFTNAGIYDATSKNDLETVGNAQVSTTINNPFGLATGNMYFDGTGDYLLLNQNNTLLNLGTAPFTIEFWFNTTSSTQYAQFIGNESGSNGFTILINVASATAGTVAVYNGAAGQIHISTSSYRDGNWHYFALTRDSSGSKMFIDGSQIGSTNTGQASTSFDSSSFRWAVASNLQYSGRDFAGYISNLRITKGYARTITASPTAAFPTL